MVIPSFSIPETARLCRLDVRDKEINFPTLHGFLTSTFDSKMAVERCVRGRNDRCEVWNKLKERNRGSCVLEC